MTAHKKKIKSTIDLFLFLCVSVFFLLEGLIKPEYLQKNLSKCTESVSPDLNTCWWKAFVFTKLDVNLYLDICLQIFVKEVTQDLWIHPQDTDNILMKLWKESNLKMRIFVCDKFVRNQIWLFLLLLSSIELCALVMWFKRNKSQESLILLCWNKKEFLQDLCIKKCWKHHRFWQQRDHS